MNTHVMMAIAQWEPAPEGSSWAEIATAWLVVVAMVHAAYQLDRGEMS